MDTQILENHKKYLERVSFYKKFDYDIEKERNFIFDEISDYLENKGFSVQKHQSEIQDIVIAHR